jgi:hypothetical protein
LLNGSARNDQVGIERGGFDIGINFVDQASVTSLLQTLCITACARNTLRQTPLFHR